MSSFNLYGVVAVVAVDGKNKKSNPSESWDEARKDFFEFISSREKQCPKNTSLGLCEEVLVNGIPKGSYTKSVKNKKFAIRAVEILKQNSHTTFLPKEL
jgi:hypothetical protein